mmetsp:Transcript_4381/g.16219  ORF Transcript_4381/g.16219 Transcript_4381/m.16219 type:complete len:240 (-) Transcript_4381:356-1075(-)
MLSLSRTICASAKAFRTLFRETSPSPVTSYHGASLSHPALYPPSEVSSFRFNEFAMRNNGLSSWHPCTKEAPKSIFTASRFLPGTAGNDSVCTRPPTRLRASKTVTVTPLFRNTRAADKPAGPPPTTTHQGARPVVHPGRGFSACLVGKLSTSISGFVSTSFSSFCGFPFFANESLAGVGAVAGVGSTSSGFFLLRTRVGFRTETSCLLSFFGTDTEVAGCFGADCAAIASRKIGLRSF